MLPDDIKERKDTELTKKKQASIDPHLEDLEAKVTVVPYSDIRFRNAACEWLIQSGQVSYENSSNSDDI
jgi:hypothetical protein